jgi:hypothetical protein
MQPTVLKIQSGTVPIDETYFEFIEGPHFVGALIGFWFDRVWGSYPRYFDGAALEVFEYDFFKALWSLCSGLSWDSN